MLGVAIVGVLPAVASAQVGPEESLRTMSAAEGVEVKLFAHEPMFSNPTNLDIDAKGRVWITEGLNYRTHRNLRPEGDRIMVLEDADGDGKADKSHVFYQGKEIDSALGICVLGNKVIVSRSPNVFIFTDADGDLKADGKPEVFFTGISGEQHDHGVHAFVFGPDGKLYFNMGDAGAKISDKSGKRIVDMAGNEVVQQGARHPENGRSGPYRKGLVFRCNPDGSEFETLGWNFRNNYEVAVDSFGTLWQSDNDDDGNQGVRINYVMEYGNYGYTDEFTGAGWNAKRTDIEVTPDGKQDKPRQHWYQNSPGVVPNLLPTGAGSPTGICVYEGDLLPQVFRNQMIHCEPGANVVRAYPVTNSGAGYGGTTANVVKATDKWFRPADVCVAPDGSILIADWYDPGVGGHAMGDNKLGNTKGRIFRVAPANTPYGTPASDFKTPSGAAEALRSPNLAVRHLAWVALNGMGPDAEPELLKLWNDANPRIKARAIQLLARIKGKERHYVDLALRHADADLRILGIRMARALKMDVIPAVKSLAKDPSPQVRRECLIALRHNKTSDAAELWAELALQHDGKDRWYLEALGLAADRNEDAFFAAWFKRAGEAALTTPAGRDVVWRSRSVEVPPLLAKIIANPQTPSAELPRYFRAFDLLQGPEGSALVRAKDEALSQLLDRHADNPAIAVETLTRVKGDNPRVKDVVGKILDSARGTPAFVDLVDQLNIKDRDDQLLSIALANPTKQEGVNAVRVILKNGNASLIEKTLAGRDGDKLVAALGASQDQQVTKMLLPMALDAKRDLDARKGLVAALARSRSGADALMGAVEKKQFKDDLLPVVGRELQANPSASVRQKAAQLIPLPPTKDGKPLPPLADLLKQKGDPARGKLAFTTAQCVTCHQIGGEGTNFGPGLDTIGDKLAKEAIYTSILFPSAGIEHNYVGTILKVKGNEELTGIIESETADELKLRQAGGIVATIRKADVRDRRAQKESIMPEDLQKGMTAQELVDLVEYLQTLKKK